MEEFRRILLNKNIIAFLLCLIVLTAWFYIYQETPESDKFTLKQYSKLYNDTILKCQTMSDDEADEWLKTMEHEAKACSALYFYWEMYDNNDDEELLSYYKSKYPEYFEMSTNLPLSESESSLNLAVYSNIIRQYEYFDDYSDDYYQIKENSNKLVNISIFSDKTSFAYKNTQKTLADFSGIENADLSIGNDEFMNSLFRDSIVDYFIIIFMIVLCLSLLKERSSGLWNIVHASANGRTNLAVTRIATLLFWSIVSCAVIFGGKLLVALSIYGNDGDLNRLLQSIEMFRNIPEIITINQFLYRYIAIKIAGTFVVGICIFSIMSTFKNLNISMIFLAILLSTQYVLYKFIRDSSVLVHLRYANIFSVIEYRSVVTKYLNIKIFGLIMEGNLFLYIILTLVAFMAIVAIVIIFINKKPFSQSNLWLKVADKTSYLFSKFSKNHRITYSEYKKTLIINKGIFVLLILLLYLIFNVSAPPINYNDYNPLAAKYKSLLEGNITNETYTFVEEEKEKLKEELDNLDKNSLASSVIGQELISKLESLEGVINEISRLELLHDTLGIDAHIMDTTLYDAIFNDNIRNYQHKTSLTVLLFTIMLLSSIFAYEKQKKMENLLHSSYCGRQKLWFNKIMVAFTLSLIVWLAVYGTEIHLATSRYGEFHSLSAPIQSLSQFSNYTKDISIKSYLFLLYLYRFFAILVLSGGILLLSTLSKTTKSALIFNLVIFLVPSALVATGVESIGFLTFIIPLSQVNNCFDSSSFYLLSILLFSILLNYILFCKSKQKAVRIGKS